MWAKERLERLTLSAARRPRAGILVVLVLALLGGLLSLRLSPSAGTDTFVSSSSSGYRATADDARHFGSDPIVILIREPLTDLVETKDLATITQLEACLAGQTVVADQSLGSFTPAPPGSHPAYGGPGSPCAQLMRAQPAKVVYGPGTFLNRAVAAVNGEVQSITAGIQQNVVTRERQAYQLALGEGLGVQQAQRDASAAGAIASEEGTQQLEQLYLTSGINGMPRIDDPQFIPQVVFDQTRGVNQPKARFAYLFPTAGSAIIQVRLRAGLSDSARSRAIRWIREAVRMPRFRLSYGGSYTVSGAPVVVDDLASQITGSIGILLLGALAVMALTLALVFRRRLRLLPLLVALAAAGITFGLMSLAGGTLTMASIAVLPILIGLAVDYAIQFQSRVAETGVGEDGRLPEATLNGVHTLSTAALATAAGFLVLLLSPVPMVRGFGLLLVIGIIVALLCALSLGSAALVLAGRDGGQVGAAVRGAIEILAPLGRELGRPFARLGRGLGRRLTRPASAPGAGASGRTPVRVLGPALRSPGRLLLLGSILAVLGWVADTQMAVQTDVTKLVPSSMPALRHLRTLERTTGVSGEIDVLVRGRDVTDPAVVSWMTGYESSLLSHYGYLETRGCAYSTLCPALSLPDLFSAGSGSGAHTTVLSGQQIRSLLAAVPSYFSQAVITPDRREATLAFGIRLMPLARQQRVIDYMRSRLHPPPGATATLTGLPVLAAQANAALDSPGRRLLTMVLGLLAVVVVLLLVLRDPERALVPLVPIVLATGWSALVLFLIGIPLNPMSATLGTLVIAISTEFSVLLSERFRRERHEGHELGTALVRAYSSTGAAVLASGVTAIAGFAVLILSSFTMLRDFGLVTLVDLSVSLGGVLLVLPAVLALSERGELLGDRAALRSLLSRLPVRRRRQARAV